MITPLSEPILGEITQGTIFSGGTADEYAGSFVWGLVVTARCDLAHDKAQIVNYLPVVSLDDWIHRDGRRLLCERIIKNLQGRFVNVLKQEGLSASILASKSPREVLAVLIEPGEMKKNAKESFRKAVLQHDHIVEIQESPAESCLVANLSPDWKKPRDKLVDELVRQNLTGYYFLPAVEPRQPEKGFVVLLREVRYLPRRLARLIAEGLDESVHRSLAKETPELAMHLGRFHDGFAMPVGGLNSPSLEHLMQTFSLLFGRIGLDDPDPRYIERVWDQQPSIVGSSQ